ncbi:hypothetical protein [Nostoc sp.]|uniref:hypothetical protein n=1 Tax=Nostoc sp. TaxID=1180 RepID=UPI002FF6FCCA
MSQKIAYILCFKFTEHQPKSGVIFDSTAVYFSQKIVLTAQAHYGVQSIREVAWQLWHVLSEIFGEPIAKANFRYTLELRPLTKVQHQ